MDDVDRAQQQQAPIERQAIEYRKPVPKIKPEGFCHYCFEPAAPPKLFCDSDCARDYDRLVAQGRV